MKIFQSFYFNSWKRNGLQNIKMMVLTDNIIRIGNNGTINKLIVILVYLD